MKQFSVGVTTGNPMFVRTTAPHDIDLDLWIGAYPTTSAYLRRAHTDSGYETLHFVPQASGTLRVGVHGYRASPCTLAAADQ